MLPTMTDPSSWLLTKSERANPTTVLDDRHPGERAWSEGNLVRPLIHGATYFRRAVRRASRPRRRATWCCFTDWQGDADERLTGEPGSEVVEVLGRADERGVDVRGLVWRSHLDQTGFFASENRHLGEQLQQRGAEVLLDMRVRTGGSHHQKIVVIRYRDDPTRDVAFVGGIDLCHSRRDDADHLGDPQAQPLAEEYGDTRPGTTSRWRSTGRRCTTSRPSSASAGRTRRRSPGTLVDWTQDQAPAARHLARPAAGAGPPPPRRRPGRHTRPAAAYLSQPAPRSRLPVRPRR